MQQFELINDKFPGARFLVQILCQNHYEWQGRIIWLDARKTKSFRSFLEMLRLIREALGEVPNEGPNKLAGWIARKQAF